jgi:hypothetical protein
MGFTPYTIQDGNGAFHTAQFLTGVGTTSAQLAMPVAQSGPAYVAASPSTISGTFTATGNSSAFVPDAGRTFNIELWNSLYVVSGQVAPNTSLGGTVYLARTCAGGSVILPLTASGVQINSWTQTASEQWQDSEYGVSYYLVCSAYSSGSIFYRMSQ